MASILTRGLKSAHIMPLGSYWPHPLYVYIYVVHLYMYRRKYSIWALYFAVLNLRSLTIFEAYYRFFTLLNILIMFKAYTSIKYCFKMSLRFIFLMFAFACHNYEKKIVHIPKFLICDKIYNCVSISFKQTLYCK